MNGFIIDTDTWIEFFHQRSGVGAHILQTPREEIFASEVSIAELTYGAVHSHNIEKHLREPWHTMCRLGGKLTINATIAPTVWDNAW